MCCFVTIHIDSTSSPVRVTDEERGSAALIMHVDGADVSVAVVNHVPAKKDAVKLVTQLVDLIASRSTWGWQICINISHSYCSGVQHVAVVSALRLTGSKVHLISRIDVNGRVPGLLDVVLLLMMCRCFSDVSLFKYSTDPL